MPYNTKNKSITVKAVSVDEFGAVPDNKLTLIERTVIRQAIDREWRGDLDVYEYAVVCFVFDRTVAWGKVFEVIRLSDFEKGRSTVFAGTGISRRKLIDVLIALTDRSVLFRSGDKKTPYHYALNLQWMDSSIINIKIVA